MAAVRSAIFERPRISALTRSGRAEASRQVLKRTRNPGAAQGPRKLAPSRAGDVFCEWTNSRPKVTHWFALDETRPIFVFVGISRLHRLFAFLTTVSNDVVLPIHGKAMPEPLASGHVITTQCHSSKRRLRSVRFTIEPGFAASLALHGAILLIAAWMAALTPKTLVVVFEGMEADYQADEELEAQAKTSGSPGSTAVSPQQQTLAPAEENHQTDATLNEEAENRQTEETPNEAEPMPSAGQSQATPANAAPGSPGSLEVSGEDQRQEARKIRPRVEKQIDPLQAYAKLLTKKVQSKLVYPEGGRQAGLRGDAAVSFTILPDGALSPGSLRIVSSSGEAKFDESALKTIRACAPFDPPHRKITLKITIKYGPRRS